MRFSTAAVLAAPILLGACATIVNGPSQKLAVSTTPPGAQCDVTREGELLGKVAPTPGTVHLDRSKNDLTVVCEKDGYDKATISQTPKFSAVTLGNILIGGLIGLIVDASTGADFYYHDVAITLAPATAAAPAAVTPAPQPTAFHGS